MELKSLNNFDKRPPKTTAMRGSRNGGRGVRTHHPSRIIANLYVCLAILFQVPWKITQLQIQHSIMGNDRGPAECADDGLLLMVFGSSLHPHQIKEEKRRNNLVRIELLWQNFLDHQREQLLRSLRIIKKIRRNLMRMHGSRKFCQRVSNFDNGFLVWWWGEGYKYHYWRAIIGPPANRH